MVSLLVGPGAALLEDCLEATDAATNSVPMIGRRAGGEPGDGALAGEDKRGENCKMIPAPRSLGLAVAPGPRIPAAAADAGGTRAVGRPPGPLLRPFATPHARTLPHARQEGGPGVAGPAQEEGTPQVGGQAWTSHGDPGAQVRAAGPLGAGEEARGAGEPEEKAVPGNSPSYTSIHTPYPWSLPYKLYKCLLAPHS